ncbi:MAG: Isoquinoline 1-oxidoreductase subunit [Methyloceanibacter sp.]|uniref:Isoquinoline 1-oxidoreductase subunit n=1 Tax=Methyloceanibacter sp. TaxID=1965321 RepID=UPI003D6CA37B
MRALLMALGTGLMVLAAGIGLSLAQPKAEDDSLKPVNDFFAITDESERSVALFTEAGKVIQHPRCLNCHPAGDRPSQGEDGHPHLPLVLRGAGGFGVVGMQCQTCHQRANVELAGVPGHPLWHLAPIEMAWQGKSLTEICVQIKDPERNGGMSLDDLIHHMSEDSLVGWGWNPGDGRTPAPGSQQQFGALIKAWVETGAVCPD